MFAMNANNRDEWSILCCLAENGYFLSEQSSYLTTTSSLGIPFQDIIQKPYRIRRAKSDDVNSLIEIETLCWEPMNMAVSRDVLIDRLQACPLDQWVATRENDGQVVGVIYTQRINSLEFINDREFKFSDIASLRVSSGCILQLVAVAVLPSVKDLQLGKALRNFMLMQAQASSQINRVVAITRCSSFIRDCSEMKLSNSEADKSLYLKYVMQTKDPTLQFHRSGGARVLSVMSHDYRPEDMENLGSGVVIGYHCTEADVSPSLAVVDMGDKDVECVDRDSEALLNTATMLPSFQSSNEEELLSVDIIKDLVLQVLGVQCASIVSAKGFEDKPFMVLGMDSLQMVDFAKRLELVTFGEDTLSSTFLFDYPTPRQVLEYFNLTDTGETIGEESSDKIPADDNGDNDHVEYAVVGMSCRFPGGADSPEKFYQLLSNRYNPVGPIPESWEWTQGQEDQKSSMGKTKRKIGLLDDISAESFDSKLFGLSKAEVASMDPHQRMLLTIGYEALLDAEVLMEEDDTADNEHSKQVLDVGKQDVGVYVGLCNSRWSGIELQAHTQPCGTDQTAVSAYSGMGAAGATAANRISFLLNLVGPSMVVDTACSSSLVAVHTACQALRAGDCSFALVAAADLLLCPYDLEIRDAAHMLSLDGLSKTFDASADGYGRGEGAGALVLRRLKDAEADFAAGKGPAVLAVVKATALNQDGKSASFTAPNGKSQQELLLHALRSANIRPSDVSYLETHGTGTPLGDPIEFSAIKSVFLSKDDSGNGNDSDADTGSPDESPLPLVLGAVKTNIGHLEGAAGMAGLIKTIMSVIHKSCPPNIHLNSLNEAIDRTSSVREVVFPHRVTPLISSDDSMDTSTLIAGVSSFGSGGTNSHVIVQSHSHTTSASFYVEEEEKYESRIRTKSRSDSIDKILITTTSKVVFLITGQGSSADLLTKSIGAGLFRSESVFERVFTECSEAFEISKQRLGICERHPDSPENNLSLVDVLLQSKSHIKIHNVALYTQCILYSLTVSMAELWESRGVEPDVLLGHSLGEYTVAAVAGILSIDDGMLMVALRADSIANTDDTNNQSDDRKGIMVALRTSAVDAAAAIQNLFPKNRTLDEGMFVPVVSVVNGPASCVVSGHASFVHEIVHTLNCSHKELVVTNAFHSPLMHKAAEVFRKKAKEFIESGHIEFNKPTKNIVSSVTGKCVKGSDMICLDYWVNHITQPVIFYESLLTLFGNRKSDKPIFPDICIVTEIGPGETLTKLVKPVNVGTIIPQQRKIQWVMSFSGSVVKRSFASDPTEQEFFQQHSARALLELKIHQLKRKFKGGNWSQTEMHRWRHRGKYLSIHNTASVISGEDGSKVSTNSTAVSRETMIQVVKNILTDVLLHSVDIDDVDEHTSLVSLGVDSLGAIQIKNQLSLEFGNLPLLSTLVFDYPSISSICEHINSQLQSAHSSVETTAEPEVLEVCPQMLEYTARNPGVESAFVTTQMQQAMLFYHLSEPDSCTFIETFSWVVEQRDIAPRRNTYRFDRNAFRSAWIATVLAHPSLRSSFDMDVVPPVQKIWTVKEAQRIMESESSSWFEYVRAPMHNKNESNCSAIVDSKTREQRNNGGIDPSGQLLFKLSLIELVDHSKKHDSLDYLIVLTLHHAIVDGYSMPSILKTLTEKYSSSFTKHDAPQSHSNLVCSSSFELFSRYEHGLLESTNSKDPVKHYRLLQLQNYWRNIMQGWSGCNEFSNMPPAVINASDAEVLRCQHAVKMSVANRCAEAARLTNVTLASLVHSAWCIVYKLSVSCSHVVDDTDPSSSSHRTSPDILYGCTATGRSAPVSHLSEVVGPVINTFPVRIQSSLHTKAYPIVDFVRKVHDQLVSSVNCETLPLPEIQRLATTYTRSIFPIIVDYQHDALFHCNFEEVSHLQMRHLALVDRIGCPLSVRIIVGQEETKDAEEKIIKNVSLKLISTSECLEYNMIFLKSILNVFEHCLDLVSSSILGSQETNVGLSSLHDIEANLIKAFPQFISFRQPSSTPLASDAREVASKTRALPPPSIPTASRVSPQQSAVSTKKVISADTMEGIAKNVRDIMNDGEYESITELQCLQVLFMLALKRWSSTSSFSIGYQEKDDAITTLSFESKTDDKSFVWESASLKSLLIQYSPPLRQDISVAETNTVLFVDNTSKSTKTLTSKKPTLFVICLHTAGGSAAQFAGWESDIGSLELFDVEFVCLELPGHGTKLLEKPSSDPLAVVETLVSQVATLLELSPSHVSASPPSFCLLGYSMGSLLAFELSRQLFIQHAVQPCHLFLLAEASPTFLAPDIDPSLPTVEFARALVDQEWYPPEFLELPEEDLEIFLQLAKADLSLELKFAKTWKGDVLRADQASILTCPVSVYYGTDDKTIFGNDLQNRSNVVALKDWEHQTSGAFELHAVQGGAHLVMDAPSCKSEVLKSISKALGKIVKSPSTHTIVNSVHLDEARSWNCQLNISLGTFNGSVLTGIQRTYGELIDLLCSPNPKDWDLPVSSFLQPAVPAVPVPTNCTVPEHLMHEPFFHERSHKAAPAVITYAAGSGERVEMSSVELRGNSVVLAERLVQAVPALKVSDVVVVFMEKGWEQVVGVLAVHLAQCVYLPMDAKSWSETRVRQVLGMSESVAVLTQSEVAAKCSWLGEVGVPVLDVTSIASSSADRVLAPSMGETLATLMRSRERADCNALGYLIYTSGSTGVPKGVCCHHQGAMNTIADLNDRFNVGPSDRVLGLSSLSFDLSVYDIFGLLTAGGALVLPPAEVVSPPDPGEWLKIVESEGVTIWNTVPAFMELLVTHAECSDVKLPSSLRLIFMSGDWIPVSLPSRIRAVSLCEDIRIISMGGATEAAIWSNIFELGREGNGIPDGWSSVPYGRPLGNQTMYVLSEELEHCEVWVTGVVYIGGAGVAKGYYKNPERTNYQFITHPRTGEYLFRTGDLGRVRPCGNIEILGREDSQVKVNGFRIELGEIERVLMQDKRLSSAVLNVDKNALCAYLVLNDGSAVGEEDELYSCLRDLCRASLTDYMVPRHFTILAEIPLSSNGKVDRDKLPKIDVDNVSSSESATPDGLFCEPSTDLENDVLECFMEILKLKATDICCERDSFFQLGGNSVSAIQLIFRILKTTKETVSVQDLFSAPTVQGICRQIERKKDSSVAKDTIKGGGYEIICLQKGSAVKTPLLLFNPAGASGLCYSDLAKHLEDSIPVYCVDDGGILNAQLENACHAQSVEEVCEQVQPLVMKFSSKFGITNGKSPTIAMGGWSYGGVISVKLTELLVSTNQAVTISSLLLFDCPLRASKPTASGGDKAENDDMKPSTDIVDVHFEYCTRLLKRMYAVQEDERCWGRKLIGCDILDLRAAESTYDCGGDVEGSLHAFCSGQGQNYHHITPGTHWSMLFGTNVQSVADILHDYLKQY